MEQKIGFIGSGNMGGAIIGGICKAGLVKPQDIIASDISKDKIESFSSQYGIQATTDNIQVVTESDIIFMAVKPNVADIVLSQIKEVFTKEKLFVSIAAGITMEKMENFLGRDKKIIRVMPNTPALVGEGMAGICPNQNTSSEDANIIKTIFESFGQAEIVTEYLMDAVGGVSGSSPAYVFMFIEAMADAAVTAGMPRAQAYKFAAQSTLGSAKMVLETGRHPGDLKDMVCSPGGSTIEGVAAMEEAGFRSAVYKGVMAAVEKTKKMAKEN